MAVPPLLQPLVKVDEQLAHLSGAGIVAVDLDEELLDLGPFLRHRGHVTVQRLVRRGHENVGALAGYAAGYSIREFGVVCPREAFFGPGGAGERNVVVVATTRPTGPGSLHEALTRQTSPLDGLALNERLIVFTVGGTIDLTDSPLHNPTPAVESSNSYLEVQPDYVVIAGETAPPPGITIIGSGLHIKASNVVLRHVAIRPGFHSSVKKTMNALGISTNDRTDTGDPYGSPGNVFLDRDNILIESCSLSWGSDQNAFTEPRFQGVGQGIISNVTFRRVFFGESLDGPNAHAHAIINAGQGSHKILMDGCVFERHRKRTPWVTNAKAGQALPQLSMLRNSVIFDSYNQAMSMASGGGTELGEFLAENNVVILGPSSKPFSGSFNKGLMFSQRVVDENSATWLKHNALIGDPKVGRTLVENTSVALITGWMNTARYVDPNGSWPGIGPGLWDASVSYDEKNDPDRCAGQYAPCGQTIFDADQGQIETRLLANGWVHPVHGLTPLLDLGGPQATVQEISCLLRAFVETVVAEAGMRAGFAEAPNAVDERERSNILNGEYEPPQQDYPGSDTAYFNGAATGGIDTKLLHFQGGVPDQVAVSLPHPISQPANAPSYGGFAEAVLATTTRQDWIDHLMAIPRGFLPDYDACTTPSCPWDCGDFDGNVGIVDFLQLLADWTVVGSPCDFDGGGVGIVDFLKLLANWGLCP